MTKKLISVEIRVYPRPYVAKDDPDKYQADIIGDDFDHHGIGETPAQALTRAAEHWEKHIQV